MERVVGLFSARVCPPKQILWDVFYGAPLALKEMLSYNSSWKKVVRNFMKIENVCLLWLFPLDAPKIGEKELLSESTTDSYEMRTGFLYAEEDWSSRGGVIAS